MKKLLFLFILVLVEAQPGLKSTLSQNGLDYLREVGIELLEKALGTLTIPDISGQAGTPIGTIDWQLTSLVLDQLVLGSSSSTFASDGLSVSISGVTCHLSMNWHYRQEGWPHISDSGSADVDVSSTTASVSIAITVASSGEPQVSVTADSVNVGDLNIHLHGGASWLYQIFVDIFSGQIKSGIDSALQNAISQNIDSGLNKVLSTLPLVVPIGGGVEIDFKLLSNPIFSGSYMTVPDLGEFYETASPQECPGSICPKTETVDEVTSEMIQFIVTDFVANSAGFVYNNLGQLKITIQDSDIPKDSPIRLNTSSFEFMLPSLYKMYPNDLLEIKLYCTQSPEAVFAPGTASVTAVGNLEMWVIQPNQQLAPAFTLSGSINTAAMASLHGQLLGGNLTYLYGNFTVSKTEIGPFNVEVFDDLLNLLFNHGVIPLVNTYLEQGIPLPTVPGLTFVNPSLGFGSRYVYVSTDVTYTPPQPETFHKIQVN